MTNLQPVNDNSFTTRSEVILAWRASNWVDGVKQYRYLHSFNHCWRAPLVHHHVRHVPGLRRTRSQYPVQWVVNPRCCSQRVIWWYICQHPHCLHFQAWRQSRKWHHLCRTLLRQLRGLLQQCSSTSALNKGQSASQVADAKMKIYYLGIWLLIAAELRKKMKCGNEIYVVGACQCCLWCKLQQLVSRKTKAMDFSWEGDCSVLS